MENKEAILEDLTNKDFFYSYTKKLSDFLTEEGCTPISAGYAKSTQRQFTQFVRTKKLNSKLKEFNKLDKLITQ